MTTSNGSLHALLILSDSALPLGSFAFSSGLESFLAHKKPTLTSNIAKLEAFSQFLHHSISNVSSTALPYVLTAYHSPDKLEVLDDEFDASTPCTVARRASIAQGKALLTIWERALCRSPPSPPEPNPECEEAAKALSSFATNLKSSKSGTQLNAHFPPLLGATCLALSLSEQETSYLFLLNHAKTLLSAAVRAGVMGPYQSQAILAGAELRGWIERCIERECRSGGKAVEDAAVTAPMMDLWMGRHEVLYSRIFNS